MEWISWLAGRSKYPVNADPTLNRPEPSGLLDTSTKVDKLHSLPLCNRCSSLKIGDLPDGDFSIPLDIWFRLADTYRTCRLCALFAHAIVFADPPEGGYSETLSFEEKFPAVGRPIDLPDNRLLQGFMSLSLHSDRGAKRLRLRLETPSAVRRIFNFEVTFNNINRDRDPAVGRYEAISDADLAATVWRSMPGCCNKVTDLKSGDRLKSLSYGAWCQSHGRRTSHKVFQTPVVMPDRILDLSCSGTSNGSSNIRLIDTRNDAWKSRPECYATLSYRWGDLRPIMTTKNNLRRHLSGIVLAELPATFRDAVRVSRALGLQYLWIDSLCIVQDDERDWETQAPKMGGVYGLSAVNIAVHSAANSSEGFLWWWAIPTSLSVGIGSRETDRQCCMSVEIPPANSDPFTKSNIIFRGWILQELMLPKNVVHFIEDQVFWECSHASNVDNDSSKSMSMDTRFSEGIRSSLVYRLSGTWLGLVETYSGLHLTELSDRPVAIQGVADIIYSKKAHARDLRLISGRWRCYLHGIFLSNIHESLLWHKTSRNLIRQKDRAPTWSWLSREGPIRFIGGYYPGASHSYPPEASLRDVLENALVFSARVMKRLKAVSFQRSEQMEDVYRVDQHVWMLRKPPSIDADIFSRGPVVCGWAVFDSTVEASSEWSFVEISKRDEHHHGLMVKSVAGRKETYTRHGLGVLHGPAMLHTFKKQSVTLV